MIAASNGASGVATLVPLVLMVAVFYFLLIRPQQRRMRQQRQLMETLEVGDEVLTIGGLFGTIRSVEDELFEVDIAPGTKIRLLKSAVARKLSVEDDDEEDAEAEDEETSGAS